MEYCKNIKWILLLVFIVLTIPFVNASIAEINPSYDCYTDGATSVFSTASVLEVSGNISGTYRTAMDFDISSIPDSAIVSSAKLTLCVTDFFSNQPNAPLFTFNLDKLAQLYYNNYTELHADIGNGTSYGTGTASGLSSCFDINLNEVAVAEIMSKIATTNKFSIGVKTDDYNYTEFYAFEQGSNLPTLKVTYTVSSYYANPPYFKDLSTSWIRPFTTGNLSANASYRFREDITQNKYVLDESIFKNNLSAIPHVGVGKINNSMYFPGYMSSQYIDGGSNNSIDFGNNGKFTVAVWIKQDVLRDYVGIVAKGNPTRTEGPPAWWNTGFILGATADGYLASYTLNNNWKYSSSSGLTAGNWTHVAYSYDGTNMYYYINGVAKGSSAFSYTDNTAYNLLIGSWRTANGWEFKGNMDELKVYNRSLSTNEILWMYNNESIGNDTSENRTGLKAEYKFDSDKYGNKTLDTGTGYNNGTNMITSNASYVAGYCDGGYKFDGAGDYVDLGSKPQYHQTTGLQTMMAWINVSSFKTYNIVMVKQSNARNGAEDWIISAMSTGGINLYKGNTNTWYSCSGAPISLNQWYHIAVVSKTVAGAGINEDLYLNGQFYCRYTTSGAGIGSTSNKNVYLGSYNGAATTYDFNGTIDEPKLFMRTLAAQEIEDIYQWEKQCHFAPNATYKMYNQNISINGTVKDDGTVDNVWLKHDFNFNNSLNISQEKALFTSNYLDGIGSTTWESQSFKMPSNKYILGATFQFNISAGASGDIIYSLYSLSGGNPSQELAYGMISRQDTTSGFKNITVLFQKAYYGTENTQYAILIKSPKSTSTSAYLMTTTVNEYADGQLLISTNSGSSWIQYSGYDAYFKVLLGDFPTTTDTPIVINQKEGVFNFTKYIKYARDLPYNYTICANDTGGTSSCKPYKLLVKDTAYSDTIAPMGSIIQPNLTKINGQVDVEVEATDNVQLDRVYMQYKNSSTDWAYIDTCNPMPSDSVCLWDVTNESIYPSGTQVDIRMIPCDTSDNCNYSINARSYIIDREAPQITGKLTIYPENQTSIKLWDIVSFRINATDFSAGINASYIDETNINTTGRNFTIMTFESGNLSTNQTSLWNSTIACNNSNTGLYSVPFYVYDNTTPTNNQFISSFLARLDNTYPQANNVTVPPSPIYNNTEVYFSVNVSDNYKPKRAIFSHNATGTWENLSDIVIPTGYTSLVVSQNYTTTSDFMSYKFYVYDDAGNSNVSEMKTIVLAGNEPVTINVTLISPANTYNSTSGANLEFQFNYTGGAVDSCNLMINGYLNLSNLTVIENVTNSFIQTFADGIYSWNVMCNLSNTQQFNSESRSFTIDSTPPYFIDPQAYSINYYDSSFSRTIQAADTGVGFSCFAVKDTTNFKINCTSGLLENNTALTSGFYSLNISANDTLGNINSTNLVSVTVSNIPSISLAIVTPDNITNTVNVTQTINFDVVLNVTCLKANCGEINVSLDPEPTTVSLDYTQDLADIYFWSSAGPPYTYGSQMKWNISTVPASSTITNATVCLYLWQLNNFELPTTNMRVWYTNDEAWDESSSVGTITAQSLTNETDVIMSSVEINTWSCFDVTKQLQESYSKSNANFTFRYEKPESLSDGGAGVSAVYMFVGDDGYYGQFDFEDRANIGSTGNRPYLNITYETTGGSSTKGLINTTAGATPFYIVNDVMVGSKDNPKSITLNENESQLVTFRVKPTGAANTYSFFAYANMTNDMDVNNVTSSWNVQILLDTTAPYISFISPTPNNASTIYVNYTTISVSVSENVTSCILNFTPVVCDALGGELYIDGDYCVHSFVANGSFNISSSLNAEVLIVAGGGSGGGGHNGVAWSGGGGAGGVLEGNLSLTVGNYSVVIGAGGAGSAEQVVGNNGENSSFYNYTATGGGGGGAAVNSASKNGLNGGSGGGGGGEYTGAKGTKTQGNVGALIGYGNDGDDGTATSVSGGGGGAGGAASGATGGAGISFSINGSAVTYAVGGSSSIAAGAANTGNGGGGDPTAGPSPAGGSGIVIVRYLGTRKLMNIINADESTTAYYNMINLNKTNYTYNVNCSDIVGNTNITETRILRYTDVLPETQAPLINFTYPTLSNATSTTNTSVVVNISILNASDLNSFIWNWNGTNYSFYDDSLVLMMNFDNVSLIGENDSLAVDVSKYSNNGTINGSNWTSSGKYGSALSFDGVDDYVDAGNDESLNINGSITLSAWVKAGSFDITTSHILRKNQRGYTFGAWAEKATIYLEFNTSYYFAQWSEPLLRNTWYHIVGTYNSDLSTMSIYVDGVLRNYSSSVENQNITGTFFMDTGNLAIGRYTTTSNQYLWNGSIDEVRIYNRSLSAAEIKQQYYSNLKKYDTNKWEFYSNESNLSIGNYTYSGWVNDTVGNANQTGVREIYITSETIPPTFTFIPNNVTINYTQSFAVNYTAGETVNWSINSTTYFQINSTGWLSNKSTTPAGTYIINVTINDSIGNQNYSMFKVTVNKNNETCAIGFNTTTIKYGEHFLVLTNCSSGYQILRNTTVITNNSAQILGAGNYNFTIYRNDTANYTFINDTEIITVTKSNMTITYYLNGVSNNLTVTYPTQVNASAYISQGNLNITRNSTLITSGNNYTLAGGYYKFNYSFDGNENYTANSTLLYATVSKASSNISLKLNGSESNISIYTNTKIWINATLTVGVGNISTYNNETLIDLNFTSTANLTNFTSIGLYNITSCYAGNENYTSNCSYTWWVNVSNAPLPDTTPPYISIDYPTQFGYYNNYSGYINVSTDGAANCTINSASWGLNSYNTNNFSFLNNTPLIDASYFFNITCNDSAGNINTTRRDFTYDTGAPIVSVNGSFITNQDTFKVYFNSTEGLTTSLNCSLYINKTLYNNTDSLSWMGTDVYMIASGVPAGNHSINVTCRDDSNNLGWNDSYYVYVDGFGPYITVTSPTAITYGTENITINFNATDPSIVNTLWFDNGTANITYTAPVIVPLSNGTYTFYFYANDSYGNLNGTTITFTIDLDLPYVSFIDNTPATNTYQKTNSIYVNVTANHTLNLSAFIDFDNSLVSWWRMDDLNSSGDLVDYTNSNNGSVNGATQVNGKLGKAFSFDGTNDYIDLNNKIPVSNVTISFWLKIDLCSGYWQTILGAKDASNAFEIDKNLNDCVFNAYSYGRLNSTFNLTQSQWYHIAIINNISGNWLYINGTYVSNNTYGYNIAPINASFGKYRTVQPLNGSLDDVMIFNRSLSADEIAALYANTTSKYVGYNFTGLSEGAHTFKAYTQNTNGKINSTTRSVTVDTISPKFTFIPNNITVTYGNTFLVNFTSNEGNFYINWSNPFNMLTNGSLTNNMTVGVGYYEINVSVNDSAGWINSTIFSVNVTRAPNVLTLSSSAGWSYLYGTSSSLTSTPIYGTPSIYINGSTFTNPVLLGVGTYNISTNISESQNYTSNTTNRTLIVSQATGLVYTYLGGTRVNKSITTGSSIWLNATLINGVGNITLFRNGTLIKNGTSPIGNYSSFTSAGRYNITSYYYGNANYTSDYETWWVIVADAVSAGGGAIGDTQGSALQYLENNGSVTNVTTETTKKYCSINKTTVSETLKEISDKLKSTERIKDDGVCQDGEYPVVDKDCSIDIKHIFTIFNFAWAAKLTILLIIILLLRNRGYTNPNILFFVALLAALLFYLSSPCGFDMMNPVSTTFNMTNTMRNTIIIAALAFIAWFAWKD